MASSLLSCLRNSKYNQDLFKNLLYLFILLLARDEKNIDNSFKFWFEANQGVVELDKLQMSEDK
jgi:hypothetical protein